MTTLKIPTEIYNLITGLLLLVAGAIDLYRADYSMALSWAIFGSMYLIMDDYTYHTKRPKTLLAGITHFSRQAFSLIGTALSVALVVYYVMTF